MTADFQLLNSAANCLTTTFPLQYPLATVHTTAFSSFFYSFYGDDNEKFESHPVSDRIEPCGVKDAIRSSVPVS